MEHRQAGTGRPTKDRSAAMTQRLLDTARLIFGQRGFAGTSIEDIAGAMRCSKHTIYHRYANKMALLEAVVERDRARFIAALATSGEACDAPLDQLRAMARTYFGFSADPAYSALYAVIMLEATSSPDMRRHLAQWAETALAPMRQLIEAAMPSAGWRMAKPEQLCALLVDLLDGEARRLNWAAMPYEATVIDRHFEQRWHIFLRIGPSLAGL